MKIIGLTGNIASGKSTVAALLRARGATVIDADQLAREAVAPETPALAAIRARWGPQVLRPDGALDRAALRAIVFADPVERAALDAIVHPEVERRRQLAIAAARAAGASIIVCDIPLLFEAGLADRFATILLVEAPEALRLARLVATRGLEESAARAMITAQWPSEAKQGSGVIRIRNDGSLADLERQVDAVWSRIVG